MAHSASIAWNSGHILDCGFYSGAAVLFLGTTNASRGTQRRAASLVGVPVLQGGRTPCSYPGWSTDCNSLPGEPNRGAQLGACSAGCLMTAPVQNTHNEPANRVRRWHWWEGLLCGCVVVLAI